jgi:hypothetical protein
VKLYHCLAVEMSLIFVDHRYDKPLQLVAGNINVGVVHPELYAAGAGYLSGAGLRSGCAGPQEKLTQEDTRDC